MEKKFVNISTALKIFYTFLSTPIKKNFARGAPSKNLSLLLSDKFL